MRPDELGYYPCGRCGVLRAAAGLKVVLELGPFGPHVTWQPVCCAADETFCARVLAERFQTARRAP